MIFINGYKNEYEFISYLNGRKKGDLHYLPQELLEKLYPHIKDNDIVLAKKYGRYAKVDMVIEVNGVKKGISIKSGSRNSVHVEKIDTFIRYLDQFGFKNIDGLLRYLYSDGTNDNTGNCRMSICEYKKSNAEQIYNINRELNKENILYSLIYRFLICSDIHYHIRVDAFISGTLYDFLWITKEEVISYLCENYDFRSSGVHVSKLFIQQWNKNINYNPKYEHCREYIQVK